MKSFSRSFLLAGLLSVYLLPVAPIDSQLAPLPDDPLAAMQTLQKANDDLLKRQDDSLKTLTDLTNAANEIRIFSRRS